MAIRLYRNEQINKQRWDRCIAGASNSLIYAHSVYLDHMCEGWHALIDDESESVMPLPVRKKMGITYSYQPPFTQQLGIFSKTELPESLIAGFLKKAIENSRLISLYLNYANYYPSAGKRCNYILDLDDSFENIRSRFRKDIVIKPTAMALSYSDSDIPEVLGLYQKYILRKHRNISSSQLSQFQKLSFRLQQNAQAFTRKITSKGGNTLSAALFLKDEKRIYYMMSANSPEGRRTDANALLLYEAIKEFSGKKLIFDFEGSEIPGVKFFFEKFAPAEQPYFHFESDRLNIFQKSAKSFMKMIASKMYNRHH